MVISIRSTLGWTMGHLTLIFDSDSFSCRFNHHNLYITESNDDVANYGYDGATIPIQAKKGGVNGGANNERRFGQFALKIKFNALRC